MGLREDVWDGFRRQADDLLHRLRTEGKLDPLRVVLARLLPAVSAMNSGDCGNCLVAEDGAERATFDLLEDLGCLVYLAYWTPTGVCSL